MTKPFGGSIYVTLTPFYKKVNEIEDVLTGVEFRNGIESIAARGVEVAKKKVLSSGTQYSNFRQRFGLGGRGRYVTGKMYDSIGSKVEQGSKQLRIRVGFVKRFEKYFAYQETGFWNWWKFKGYNSNGKSYGPNANPGFGFVSTGGKWTSGMFALRDAKEEMLKDREVLFNKLRARLRRL